MARRFVSVVPQTYEECGDSALMETRGGARGYADRLAGYYGILVLVMTKSINSQLNASGNPYDGTLLAKLESAYTDTGDHGSTMFVFIVEEQTVGGYEEGVVGSSHSYAVGSGEISCGMFGPLEGLFFGGYGSDRGSGPKVPVSSLGDPAGARRKPWSGYVYGAGISVDSPLGTSET